jgi:hypothetical protein
LESAEFLMILSNLPVETVAMFSVLVFGNVLPLGTIGVLMWLAQRHDRTNNVPRRSILTVGARSLGRAA